MFSYLPEKIQHNHDYARDKYSVLISSFLFFIFFTTIEQNLKIDRIPFFDLYEASLILECQ